MGALGCCRLLSFTVGWAPKLFRFRSLVLHVNNIVTSLGVTERVRLFLEDTSFDE